MNEVQILFPVEPKEFWTKLKLVVEEAVALQMDKVTPIIPKDTSNGQKLLKGKEVCEIFSISKPTLYEWMHQGKLVSIKIRTRRFFRSEDIAALIESGLAKSL